MVGEANSPSDSVRLDLRTARVLCADENGQGLDILGQILMGFGVQHVSRAQDVDTAKRLLSSQAFDLVMIDAGLGGNGHELVRWLRGGKVETNRYLPVFVLAGHTPRSQVDAARNAGSSFVLTKPISAKVLLDRIFWVGRAGRLFVEADTYIGPDRRFRNEGVPEGGKGRRKSDLNSPIGAAREPNMSQAEVDDLMKPQKVSL